VFALLPNFWLSASYPAGLSSGNCLTAAAAGIVQSCRPSRPSTPRAHDNMAKTLIGALALASQALAFSNTSPFFLFSTAEYASPQPILMSRS
jgi:hypothetical protein